MKSHTTRKKIIAPLSASRWAAYTAAGAATAMGCAASAEAAINVVNVNELFNAPAGGSDLHYFQLTTGNSFGLIHQRVSTYSGGSVGISKFGIFGGGAFIGNGSSFVYASKLGPGVNIAGGAFASGIIGTLAFGQGYAGSQWLTPGQGYIGIKFNDAHGTETGWVSITANGVGADNTFTLNSYAYTTAGESIKTGQTSLVPEPGSLALLAVGGAGLLAWRQRRAKSAALSC